MGHPAHHHKINYIEFSSTDIARTKEFYSNVFGWAFQDWGPDYVSFSSESGGIDGGFAKRGAGAQDGAQLRRPNLQGELEVDEPRLHRGDGEPRAMIIASGELTSDKSGADPLGERHRVLPNGAGQHHRRVGCEIPMGGIARRLDGDPAEIEPARQSAIRCEVVEGGQHEAAKVAEDINHVGA